MALNGTCAKFLIHAKTSGVNFERTLVVGRQMVTTSPILLWRMLKEAELMDYSRREWMAKFGAWPSYSEPFFQALGARELTSLDASNYEDADVIHDLNTPVSDDLHERFDVVLDGGTIEHVFHYSTALQSCMEMVAVGGHLILLTPTNNMSGHGFYQLSPELFYRALSPENGFEVEEIVMFENKLISRRLGGLIPFTVEATSDAYAVRDPQQIGQRVEVTSKGPTLLFVLARRTHKAAIFARPAAQSDYASLWLKRTASGPRAPGRVGAVNPQTGAGKLALTAALHLSYALIPAILRPFAGMLRDGQYRRQSFTSPHPGLERLPGAWKTP